MNKEEQTHLNAFLNTFVPSSHKARWQTLVASNKIKWEKIKPYDIWPENNHQIKYCRLLEENLFELFKNKKYAQHLNNNVAVFPCGHDSKKPESTKLDTAIRNEYDLLEGIISIIPGKLALLLNHDGEVCIFEKK
jgi:hypothetical protein